MLTDEEIFDLAVKIKTAELTGAALDWAVAKCEAGPDVGSFLDGVVPHPDYNNFHPSTDWSRAGSIIEREGIELLCNVSSAEAGRFKEAHPDWFACLKTRKNQHWHGTTPLVAAMRAFVASHLGDEVEIPGELLK